MITIKKYGIFLLTCCCFLFTGCSSDNVPIAEVFLGTWEIFQKNENNSGLVDATGEMTIDFGNEVITFIITVDDDTDPISISGIVHNEYLYDNSLCETQLGSLDLTKSGTLNITIYGEGEDRVIYYGR